MLSIDEAIAHEKELAKEIYVEAMLCHTNPDDGELDDCIQRGKYHEQLAEWLEDYKRIKMLIPIEQALKAEYNMGIDDFAEKLKQDVMTITFGLRICDIDRVAEQLKAGGNYEQKRQNN